MSQGRRTPVQHFRRDDYVIMLVDFTWPDVEQNGGRHRVNWNWYKEGKLVSKSQAVLTFVSAPYTLHTQRAAATLGTGHFRVETVVDDQVTATGDFDIAG